jgi:hypothetical protein
MGSPDPRAFSRNKRGVAGSLVWINFDRHALLDLVRKSGGKFLANLDDIRPQFRVSADEYIGQTTIFDAGLVRDSGVPVNATIDQTAYPDARSLSLGSSPTWSPSCRGPLLPLSPPLPPGST